MTNKYSELSDFEINKLVAIKLGYKEDQITNHFNGNGVVVGGTMGFYFSVVGCDASKSTVFDLMVDNGISLISHSKNNKGTVIYTALSDFVECNFNVDHENPCRAIAECFLLMKDAENEER